MKKDVLEALVESCQLVGEYSQELRQAKRRIAALEGENQTLLTEQNAAWGIVEEQARRIEELTNE